MTDILELSKKIAKDLGDLYTKLGPGYIYDRLIDSYKDIYNNCNWSFFLVNSKLLINKYLKLTVETANSREISFTGVSGSEIAKYLGQKYYNLKEQIAFNIESVDTVNLKITIDQEQNYIPSVGEYVYLYFQDYALPVDCAFNREICVVDFEQGRSLAKLAEPTYSHLFKSSMFDISEPIAYISKSKDYFATQYDYNYNYIGIYPSLSPSTKYLGLIYYRKPFGNFDEITILQKQDFKMELPEEFTHLLYWKVMENCYARLGDARTGYAMEKAMRIFKDLRNRNNGDEAMIRIFSEYPPYTIEEIDGIPTKFSVRLV